MNYKETIFLPYTDFQMRANLSQKEPEILELWESTNNYQQLQNSTAGRKRFILHDGPPFANGTPHAGTAMNKVIKDIIARMKRMQGFDVPFIPGWDCHGLPIEWKVEEQLRKDGIKKDSIPVAEFRNKCRDFASYWIDVQKSGFKRLGISGDWNSPYLTMNPSSEAAVIRQISQFILSGALYRGEKPVFWSVVEKTALADAEIEYIDKTSASIYVAFKIKKSAKIELENAYCVIWTTTPWTIPGNRAISYSKDITYCLVEARGKKLVVAQELIDSFSSTLASDVKVVDTFSGEELAGTICAHPFEAHGYDFDVPLIHGSHVDVSAGTGLVHTAPGHGLDDFIVCKEHNIPVPRTVDEAGVYYDCVPLFAGKHIFKIEQEMLETLSAADALLHSSTIKHSYPHSWRSKAPLIFRTTPQWFISLDKTNLREKALHEIDEANWIPKQGYNRIKAFVENRGDWCISRQRVWGVPIPIFVDRNTGEALRDKEVLDRIAYIFEQEGSNAWFSRDPQDFLGEKYDAKDFEQIKDTLDVWFESSSTFSYVVKQYGASAKADLYVEGSDQHRGWFQHSLLNSCGTFGDAPFKTVMTHGFIVDEQGRKMSKSLGNTVTLDDVVQNLGADIFRLWVACSDFTQDLKLGKNILRQLEDVYRKIRNTIRYILGALHEYNSELATISYDEMPDLEKWVLHRITEIHDELMKHVSEYDINKYFSTLYNFCTNDLSAFFFDIRKDCLYCDSKDNLKRKSYRYVLNILKQYILRWLAPITVFTAEEAWLASSTDKSSIHLTSYLTPDNSWKNDEIAHRINEIKEIRRIITSALEIARKDKLIGSSLQARVDLYDPNGAIHVHDTDFWLEVAITSEFHIHHAAAPDGAFTLDNSKHIGVVISNAAGDKCERCWKITPDLNEEKLCSRCAAAVHK